MRTLAYPPIMMTAFLLAMACSSPETLEKDTRNEPDVQEQDIQFVTGCQADNDCDDGNPCTEDRCLPDGSCTTSALADAPCDDGNACTQDDACTAEGQCVGAETIVCDDDNPCTLDTCDPKSGCTFEPQDGETECDGSLCTTGDSCVDGECASGTPVICDDANSEDCQFTTCESKTGECTVVQFQATGHPCLDGNPCTDGDTCGENGECLPGTPHDCVSQNPCKTSWCNEQAKEGTNPCVMEFLPEQTPCDDGSKCTDADSCTLVGEGTTIQCQGQPVDCDDSNPCTLDTCNEELGCLFEPKTNGTPCPLPGGGNGNCQGGVCSGEEPVCDDGIACTNDSLGPGDVCQYTPNDALCNDSNPCTDDFCQGGVGCQNVPNTLPCNDNDPCTSGETCSQGSCSGGQPTDCDDAIECTVDSCQPGVGCVHDDSNCPEECVPYTTQSCYTGPGGTQGVGICEAGYRQCRADGTGWSPCYDEVLPLAADICNNGLDDNCNGSQADENCTGTGNGVWVDYDNGSDTQGDGSFNNPYQTLTKGVSTGKDLVIAKSDADGTTYPEIVKLSMSHQNIVITTWGPTRPVVEGGFDIVHCYDCTVENFELRYPVAGAFGQDGDPDGVIDAVHNYRNTFRNLLLTAPNGIPSGTPMAHCHHGYDNLFEDVVVDKVVLLADGNNGSFAALHWQDHGSGTQFVRCRMNPLMGFDAPDGASLTIQFITLGGYCGGYPDGVSAVRNCVTGGYDLNSYTSGNTVFIGFDYWCYFPQDELGGVEFSNNTFSHIGADSVKAVDLDMATDIPTVVVNNIIGPYTGNNTEGIRSDHATAVLYTDFYEVANPVTNAATQGAGCIAQAPNFVNGAGGDFHLQAPSPCINSGSPGTLDPDGSAADMGCYGGPEATW